MPIAILSATPSDYPAIHQLNEESIPHVSNLTLEKLSELAAMCSDFSLVRDDQGLLAFLMLMLPGRPYRSENYRWFSERYPSFLYIDRVAVAERAKGKGLGRALYVHAEQLARTLAPLLACEINLDPPNPESMEFHRKLGFVEVGQQNTEQGKKRVSLQIKQLAAVP